MFTGTFYARRSVFLLFFNFSMLNTMALIDDGISLSRDKIVVIFPKTISAPWLLIPMHCNQSVLRDIKNSIMLINILTPEVCTNIKMNSRSSGKYVGMQTNNS